MGMQAAVIEAFDKAGLKPDFDLTANQDQVRAFFLDRIKQLFAGEKLRHDIVDAVTDTHGVDIANVIEAAQAIDSHKDDADFKGAVEALTRVLRIAKKGKFGAEMPTVNPDLFVNPSEQQLYDAVEDVKNQFADRTVAENFTALRSLAPVISTYFDENMIMDKDEAIRQNRLAQLTILARLAAIVGNLNELIVK